MFQGLDRRGSWGSDWGIIILVYPGLQNLYTSNYIQNRLLLDGTLADVRRYLTDILSWSISQSVSTGPHSACQAEISDQRAAAFTCGMFSDDAFLALSLVALT